MPAHPYPAPLQHPHGCEHTEPLPRQQHAPLSGSGFSCCHPRGDLDTQQNWQGQRDPGGGEETNKENTMGRDKAQGPCCRARPLLNNTATTTGKGTAEECGRAGGPLGRGDVGDDQDWERGMQSPWPFEPPSHQRPELVAPFRLQHLETQPRAEHRLGAVKQGEGWGMQKEPG